MWKGNTTFPVSVLILGSLSWKVPDNEVAVRKMWNRSITFK